MDKTEILQAMFEVIKESTNWNVDCDEKEYAYFINGVCLMTEALMIKLKSKENKSCTSKLDSSSLESRLAY